MQFLALLATLLGGVAAVWFFVDVGARARRNREPVLITNVVCRETPGSKYARLSFRLAGVSSKRVVIPAVQVSVVSHEPIAASYFWLFGHRVYPIRGRVAVAAQAGDYEIEFDVPEQDSVLTLPALPPSMSVRTADPNETSSVLSAPPPRPRRNELGHFALMPGEADDFLVDALFESPVRYRFRISAVIEGADLGREKRVLSEEVVFDATAPARMKKANTDGPHD